MGRHGRWLAVVAIAALAAACGGGTTKEERQEAAAAAGAATMTAQPATATPTPTALDYRRLEKYIPSDEELPDHVAYQATLDLSNEKATTNIAELKQFQDTGRLTGVQAIFSVEVGTRTLSLGISYYNNTQEPKKLLRRSGDPAAVNAPGRFQVPGLGDEHIAQRLKLGSGEATAHVIAVAWVRGPFFVSLWDMGGTEDTPTEIVLKVARTIDGKLAADPKP